jgi:hypothetical protein
VLGLLLAAGCSRDDADGLARVGRKLQDRAEALASELQSIINLDLGGHTALETRVLHRLRWDRTLADQAITVKAQGSEVELHGTVADAAQKRRAVEIAESTVGVEKVIDQLRLADEPANPEPPAAPPPPPPPAVPPEVPPLPDLKLPTPPGQQPQ